MYIHVYMYMYRYVYRIQSARVGLKRERLFLRGAGYAGGSH